jgi:uncharacterized protein
MSGRPADVYERGTTRRKVRTHRCNAPSPVQVMPTSLTPAAGARKFHGMFRRLLLCAVAFTPLTATLAQSDLPPRATLTETRAALADLGPLVLAPLNEADPGLALNNYVNNNYPRDGAWDVRERLYRAACALGSPNGCHNFANMLSFDEAPRLDRPRATRIFLAMCERSFAQSCASAGYLTARDTAAAAQRSAHALVEKACTLNDGQACLARASEIYRGRSVAFNHVALYQSLEKACSLNVKTACDDRERIRPLATQLELLNDQPAEVLAIYRRDQKGDSLYRYVSQFFNQSRGTLAGNPEQVLARVRIYALACERSHIMGCAMAGVFYDAIGDRESARRAYDYYTRACNGGNGAGCALAGKLHAPTRGLFTNSPENNQAAIALAAKGCATNETTSCAFYGMLLFNSGRNADARAPLTLACNRGDRDSCTNLSHLNDGTRTATASSSGASSGPSPGTTNFALCNQALRQAENATSAATSIIADWQRRNANDVRRGVPANIREMGKAGHDRRVRDQCKLQEAALATMEAQRCDPETVSAVQKGLSAMMMFLYPGYAMRNCAG